MPTYDITAPNGKQLSVTGDHTPTESELKDIFKAAGVASEDAPPKPESAGPFDPSTAGFGGRVVNAAVDVPVGMAKGAAQLAYAIPGVQSGIESMWGLPKDSLTKAVESTNDSQGAGKLIDLALGAKGIASIPAGTSFAADQSTALPVAENVGSRAAGLSVAAVQAVRKELFGSGPLTQERVMAAVAKWGINAVKVAGAGKLFGLMK